MVNLPLLNVVEDLLAGRLLALLPGWQSDAAPLNLVVSHRSQITSSLRALHQCLVEHCTDRMARYQALTQDTR